MTPGQRICQLGYRICFQTLVFRLRTGFGWRAVSYDGHVSFARRTRSIALSFTLFVSICSASTAAEPERCVTGQVVTEGAESESPLAATSFESSLTIASLNMAGKMKIVEPIAAWIDERAIDVLFLQEVGQEHGDGAAFMAALRERLGLSYAYAPATPFENGHMQGLAIVSRYPLTEVNVQQLQYNHLRFRRRCRIALGATISTPAGPIRVTNVHLDTRINSSRRIEQLTPAVEALDVFEGPQIIGGDFNTLNIKWFDSMWPIPFAEHQGRAVRDELESAGFGTPFGDTRPTFKFMGLPLKLDWLYLRRLEPNDVGVDDVPLSDHRGIWTRASLTSSDVESATSNP